MDNDTYLHNSTVIKKLDDLSVAIGGSEVPTTTTKTNSDFVIGINKSIDAASGKTGVEYPPYSHNTLVTNKLDELAEAISEGGGGGPAPVMGALTATENGNYIPSDYDYDGFNSVNVNVPEPPTPVTDILGVTENGTYLPSDYSCDAFSQVNVNVAPTPTPVTPQFTKTVLGSNSTIADSITLSDDYHNYDFIEFELTNNAYGTITKILVTPSMLDSVLDNYNIVLNEFSNTEYFYCSYNSSTYTFTRIMSRNCYISKVTGMVCSNMTVVETEIYSAPNIGYNSVTITTQENLLEYDAILTVMNGKSDEIQPCTYVTFAKSPFSDYNICVVNPYNKMTLVNISEHQMTAAWYYYVVGIKFTPNQS